MRTLSLAVLVTSVALAGAARAEPSFTPAAEDPRAAYAESDRNRDGQLDREEFHQRQVDVFYRTDADKNGTLTLAELEKLDTKSTFAKMDDNENASLSLYEFVTYRFGQFDEADTGADGLLSLEEVEEYLR